MQQCKELKAGCEVAVATPGRMVDLIKMKACATRHVTYLVLDEADRMFDLGFEQQARGFASCCFVMDCMHVCVCVLCVVCDERGCIALRWAACLTCPR